LSHLAYFEQAGLHFPIRTGGNPARTIIKHSIAQLFPHSRWMIFDRITVDSKEKLSKTASPTLLGSAINRGIHKSPKVSDSFPNFTIYNLSFPYPTDCPPVRLHCF
jgi:hypothetical protein